MINAHFIAHGIRNNAHLKAHYVLLTACIILTLSFLIIPFTSSAIDASIPDEFSSIFVHNSQEGYRILAVSQNHKTTTPASSGLKAAKERS